MSKTPTLATIASAYSVSRQWLFEIMRKTGLTHAEVCNPDLVFAALLENKSSRLRSRLASPTYREKIRTTLSH